MIMKRFRLIIGLLVLTIVILVGYNVTQLRDEITERQYISIINDLSGISNEFSIWISNKKDMLDTTKDVIDNFTYEEVTQWHTENPYLNINNDNPDVTQVYIGLRDGSFITGGQWVPPDDYDPTTRVWYQGALAAGDTIVSDLYIDLESGKPTVTISSPMFMEGQFVGVISADVFISNVNEFLQKQITDKSFYTYIVDDEGLIVIHTNNDSIVGKNVYTDLKDDVLINYFDEVKKTGDMVRMSYVFEGKDIRGIIQPIDKDWYIGVASVYDNQLFFIDNIGPELLILNTTILLVIGILLMIIMKSKSELDSKNKLLQHDNEKDFLTNVYNRRYFNLHLEGIWESKNELKKVSLLMLDIDKFKEYNDNYGHASGDKILKDVCESIKKQIRKEDVLARYGGEEFAIILEDVQFDVAYEIAEKIRVELYQLSIEHVGSQMKYLTISIGCATVSPSQETITSLIDLADAALYKAKHTGRNKVVMSKPKI